MGRRTGYVAGAFDAFSVRHLDGLHHAAKHGDSLIANGVSDEHLRVVTAGTSVAPLADRTRIVRSHRQFRSPALTEHLASAGVHIMRSMPAVHRLTAPLRHPLSATVDNAPAVT